MDFNSVEPDDEDAGFVVRWQEDYTTDKPKHWYRVLTDVPPQSVTANDVR